MIPTNHAAARAYAKAGWPVFALQPGDKKPFSGSAGFKDATTDLAQIDAWWGEHPNANIGFEPEGAGLCVIDEDTDKGGYWPTAPGDVTVKTPHGKHFYYAGSLPGSAGKLGPAVDTRGRGSYVLLPPSVVDGLAYRWDGTQPTGPWDCPDVPPWVVERLNTNAAPRAAVAGVELDQPFAIMKAAEYLARKAPMDPDDASQDDYAVAARVYDFGVSTDQGIELAIDRGGDREHVERVFANAAKYAQNDPGCDQPTDWQAVLNRLNVQYEEPKVSVSDTLGEWVPHDPRNPADMPEIEFFDDDKLIPKIPDGCVGIVFGKRGEHKTNVVLSILANSRAERILYAAGEGAYGVERDRVSARPSLLGRIKLLPRVPLFTSPDQVRAFIAGSDSISYRPDIVVLDTLATLLAGEDTNSDQVASLLTDNGPAGMIKRAWNCAVVIVAHAGKDVTKGVRGSSGFEGNVDFVVRVTAAKDQRAIEVYAEKERDAPDGFSTYYQYEASGVPVPVRISEKEYKALFAKDNVVEIGTPVQIIVQSYLRLNGFHTWGSPGIENTALAKGLVEQEQGPRPGETGDAGVAAWDTCVEKWRQSLNNARTKAWAKKCYDSQIQDGGEKPILRWFCAPVEF